MIRAANVRVVRCTRKCFNTHAAGRPALSTKRSRSTLRAASVVAGGDSDDRAKGAQAHITALGLKTSPQDHLDSLHAGKVNDNGPAREYNTRSEIIPLLKFALPTLCIAVTSPLLSLVDTSVVGLASEAQLAAMAPATALSDGVGYILTFIPTAVTNLVALHMARKHPRAAGLLLIATCAFQTLVCYCYLLTTRAMSQVGAPSECWFSWLYSIINGSLTHAAPRTAIREHLLLDEQNGTAWKCTHECVHLHCMCLRPHLPCVSHAGTVVSEALGLSAVICVAIAAVLLVATPAFFGAVASLSPEMISTATEYVRWRAIGLPFAVGYSVMQAYAAGCCMCTQQYHWNAASLLEFGQVDVGRLLASCAGRPSWLCRPNAVHSGTAHCCSTSGLAAISIGRPAAPCEFQGREWLL